VRKQHHALLYQQAIHPHIEAVDAHAVQLMGTGPVPVTGTVAE
jgi:hypothetical protein